MEKMYLIMLRDYTWYCHQNNGENIGRKGFFKCWLTWFIWAFDPQISPFQLVPLKKKKKWLKLCRHNALVTGSVIWFSVAVSMLPLAENVVFCKRLTWNWQHRLYSWKYSNFFWFVLKILFPFLLPKEQLSLNPWSF